MKNYIGEGETINVTAGADYSAGDMIAIGTKVGVCVNDIANGATGVAAMSGIYEVAKEGTDTPAQGGLAYHNATNNTATTTASTNKTIGIFWEAVASGVATVKVRLGF